MTAASHGVKVEGKPIGAKSEGLSLGSGRVESRGSRRDGWRTSRCRGGTGRFAAKIRTRVAAACHGGKVHHEIVLRSFDGRRLVFKSARSIGTHQFQVVVLERGSVKLEEMSEVIGQSETQSVASYQLLTRVPRLLSTHCWPYLPNTPCKAAISLRYLPILSNWDNSKARW